MNKKKQETAKFIGEIKAKKKKIEKLKPNYEKFSTLFHSRAEVEGLYQTLSEHAGINDLVITKIEKQDIKSVSKADAIEKSSGKKSKKKKKKKKKKKNNKKNQQYNNHKLDEKEEMIESPSI